MTADETALRDEETRLAARLRVLNAAAAFSRDVPPDRRPEVLALLAAEWGLAAPAPPPQRRDKRSRRPDILADVRAHPGTTVTEIARRTGFGRPTVECHVRLLTAAGRLVATSGSDTGRWNVPARYHVAPEKP